MFTREQILKEIDSLIDEYKILRNRAMDNDDELRVYQFCGSMVALDILRGRFEEPEEDR